MPTAIVDLDLDGAATLVDCGERYQRAFVVIRRQGVPIAQSLVPLERGRFRAGSVLEPFRARAAAAELVDLAAAAAPYRDATTRSATIAVCTRERPEDLARCLAAIRALEEFRRAGGTIVVASHDLDSV
ncbi:MAG: hypothetical protein ACRDGR_03795, partial [bacterium]